MWGPTNKLITCETCHGDFHSCCGHFGYLPLVLPVYNVGYMSHVVDILKCICKMSLVKRCTSTSSYLLSLDDIGFSISVSCEPVRKGRARGPIVLSEQIGSISPGPPTCKSLEFHGSMVEGGQLTFIASYSGGEKGGCFFEWFRVKDNGKETTF
ncbi:unnamed protein product [Lactuca virosa]|uniref:DNA-directed RNA polymerase n=1 Tax=Lactuca virosa TaxID=75947 RepID=A0AAU9M4Q9_9ASTR|nr:unnamed protein product [Lactuca virosa]